MLTLFLLCEIAKPAFSALENPLLMQKPVQILGVEVTKLHHPLNLWSFDTKIYTNYKIIIPNGL
jgi:hypothetical protein